MQETYEYSKPLQREPIISALLVVRNEEKSIRQCLENVRDVVDEIIVVDGKSQDKTVAIASKYTNRIFIREPKGIVEYDRNYMISQINADWILVIDADELLSKSLKDHLRRLAKQTNVDAYVFPRLNYYLGRPLLHGCYYPDNQLRLLKKGCVSLSDRIHSVAKVTGNVKWVEYPIIHKMRYQGMTKLVRYAEIYARQQGRSRGMVVGTCSGIYRAVTLFFSIFFKQKGVKDGVIGFVATLRISLYVFLEQFMHGIL